jgi:YHS domain-containing protein
MVNLNNLLLINLKYLSTRARSVMDPVCGMDVGEDTRFKLLYRGRIFYFCSRECMREFQRDPEGYIKSGPRGMPGG